MFTSRGIGRSVRVSASVTGTAGSLPGSGTSAAASAAIADLLYHLDNDLEGDSLMEHFAENSDTRNQRKINLKNLASSIGLPPAKASLGNWVCTEDEGHLVHQAALCSKAIYGYNDDQAPARGLPTHDYAVRPKLLVPPSEMGKLKATAIFEVEKNGTEPRTTTLIVAVRGSADMLDWLVNFDNQLRPCPELINVTFDTTPIEIHKGFAECAKALIPRFSEQLATLLSYHGSLGKELDVVFAGHSGGGAVAMLLYAHFLANKFQYPMLNRFTLRFSCITFGAPPIFGTDVTPLMEALQSRSSRRGLMLAFAAEGDPIVRMDAAYARLLAFLYHKASSDESGPLPIGNIELQPLSLFRLGKIIMLSDLGVEENEVDLRARLLREEDLSQLLWSNLFAHKKILYAEQTAYIAAGFFNGGDGWKDVPKT